MCWSLYQLPYTYIKTGKWAAPWVERTRLVVVWNKLTAELRAAGDETRFDYTPPELCYPSPAGQPRLVVIHLGCFPRTPGCDSGWTARVPNLSREKVAHLDQATETTASLASRHRLSHWQGPLPGQQLFAPASKPRSISQQNNEQNHIILVTDVK